MADDLHVDITVNTTQAQGAVDGLEGNIGDLRTDLLALNETVERFEQGFYQAMSKSSRATDQTTQSVKKSSAAWDRQNRIYEDYLYAQDRATGSTLSGRAAMDQSTTSINSQRYALYDLATTYGVISAAALAASGYVVKVGADFETAFTNVERTTDSSGQAIETLRADLVDLSTQIPLTFEDTSQIATLGNQLGVASNEVAEFTETVAQFSAVTGISIDETAQSFGSLGNILGIGAEQYESLGSAIALAGRRGVTTEAQILSLARETAQQATSAGFAADEVVGLAASLGNLRLPPERSRGALTLYFQTLNKAIADGGPALDDFAQVIGVTSAELEGMVRGGEGLDVFRRFITNLQDLDNVDTTAALDRLNLAQLRVSDVFQRLSSNVDTVNKSFADASQGYGENTELARQYALIVDDLSSQFMLLVNSVNALIEELTGGAVPGIAALVGGIADAVNGFREFAKENSWVAVMAQGLAVLTLIVGVFTAIRTAQLLATASSYAFITAQQQINVAGATGGIRGLIGMLLGYTATANGATAASSNLRNALVLLGRATVIFALIQGATQLIFDFAGSMKFLTDGLYNVLRVAASVSEGVRALAQNFVNFLGPLGGAAQGILDTAASIDAGILDAARGLQGWASTLPSATDATDSFTESTAGAVDTSSDFSSALGDLGNSAADTAAQVRTLVDYANDLSTVFSRSFDIRFGSQSAIDDAASSWFALTDQVRDNERALADLVTRMADYQVQIGQLTADRNVKQYFLDIAELYGDTLRAGVLRADLAKIDQDIADAQRGLVNTSEDVADATAAGSKELLGSSKEAINNRRALLGLVQQYQTYIQALAASGADQATLNAAIAQSEQEFLAQARALGFSDSQLQIYTQSFRDMKVAVDNVPKNITVTANVDPAIQALNELEAKLKSVSASGASALQAPNTAAFTKAMEAAAKIAYYQGVIKELSSRTPIPMSALDNAASSLDYWVLVSKGYADGGFTGKGGKYEAAGVVHRGEYVTPKKEVNQRSGLPYWMEARSKGYYNGGYVGPVMQTTTPGTRVQLVELVAGDKALLNSIAERVGLNLSGTALQNAVTAGAVNSTNRGKV